MSCVNHEIGRLKQLSNKIGAENIIILASYSTSSSLLSFKRINKIDCEVYNIPIGTLKNSIEPHNIPYMFIMDSNMLCKNIFIPIKEMTQISEIYFESITKYFSTL